MLQFKPIPSCPIHCGEWSCFSSLQQPAIYLNSYHANSKHSFLSSLQPSHIQIYFLGHCYTQLFSTFTNERAQNCTENSTQDHLSQFLRDVKICPYADRQHSHCISQGDAYLICNSRPLTSLKSTLTFRFFSMVKHATFCLMGETGCFILILVLIYSVLVLTYTLRSSENVISISSISSFLVPLQPLTGPRTNPCNTP